MSGVSAANSRRAYRHTLRYVLVAATLQTSFLPFNLLALAIALLASLHFSLNHGARVFPHLLGFLGEVMVITFTTPAATASFNRKFSTAVALSVLLRDVSVTSS
jgi:hypothetical protein